MTRKKGGVHLKAGMILAGKYQIIRPLGKGAEGSVWLALHRQTEQLWAVKEIPRKEEGREFHELNMMKKLRHPSLPQVVDVLEGEGQIYLIMEYIYGSTLSQLVEKHGRLPLELVLDAGEQLCNALCYLHGRPTPVFHLDLKPANVILQKSGRLVLVDFGAAWKPCMGEQEQRWGTVGFAAPEQYDSNAPLDGRTDIYGLGATLYYLVSGVRYSESMAKSRIPGCPDYLAELIRICIRKDPQKRYENSRKLLRHLVRLKKKYGFQKQRYRFWTALLLAVLALGLAVRAVPREFVRNAGQEWDYDKLLEEALRSPGEESRSYYQKAVYMAPGRREAYLQYIAQAGNDGVFGEEEKNLRTLLHTIPLGQEQTFEELLAENSGGYGEMAYRLGLLYWYGYEKDGKRIAGAWFLKAVEAAEAVGGQSWSGPAKIYAHMSGYYGVLEGGTGMESREAVLKEHWSDVRELLRQQDMERESPVLLLQFYLETMEELAFLSEDLRKTGVTSEELEALREELLLNTEALASEAEAETLTAQLAGQVCTAAETAGEVIAHLQQKEAFAGADGTAGDAKRREGETEDTDGTEIVDELSYGVAAADSVTDTNETTNVNEITGTDKETEAHEMTDAGIVLTE